ncbi:hypothetical protein BC937DRAFT_89153 [Endogone sp. FLAS-F59071]|nr:hypothetical protein BC937DRAFT_89153 [Endogone sp. FLAS-F59071]|eukprot:RUS18092.1 hypothetical protein BC937DRAFT_89153 [Endogone sp. FLAS-F59071]
MREETNNTEGGPGRDYETVAHANGSTRGEIIKLLSEREIAGVEDGRPEPGVNAEDDPAKVVWTHLVTDRDLAAKDRPIVVVHVAVADGEGDGSWLLDTPEAIEGPFAIVLNDRLFSKLGNLSDRLHASVLAVLGTGPKSKAEGEGELGIHGTGCVNASCDAMAKLGAFIAFGSMSRRCKDGENRRKKKKSEEERKIHGWTLAKRPSK